MRFQKSTVKRKRIFIVSFLLIAVGVAAIPFVFFLRGEYDRRYPPISFNDVAEDRAVLMDGVESYALLRDFVQQLDARNLEYQVIRPEADSGQTGFPAFDVVVVDIQSYAHLGYVGQLSVNFFNNRLSSMRFYPIEFDGYLTALRDQVGVDVTAELEAMPSENVNVWSATQHTRGSYVGWEDTRLKREFDLWMKLYGFG